jgi:hypothetical protein
MDFRREPTLWEARHVVSAAQWSHFDAFFEHERGQNERGNSQEQERHNHPGEEENANCIIFHASRCGLVGIGDARSRDEKGCE